MSDRRLTLKQLLFEFAVMYRAERSSLIKMRGENDCLVKNLDELVSDSEIEQQADQYCARMEDPMSKPKCDNPDAEGERSCLNCGRFYSGEGVDGVCVDHDCCESVVEYPRWEPKPVPAHPDAPGDEGGGGERHLEQLDDFLRRLHCSQTTFDELAAWYLDERVALAAERKRADALDTLLSAIAFHGVIPTRHEWGRRLRDAVEARDWSTVEEVMHEEFGCNLDLAEMDRDAPREGEEGK